MSQKKKHWRPELDLDTEAPAALDEARALPHGPERTEAMKKQACFEMLPTCREYYLRNGGDPRKTRDFATTLNNELVDERRRPMIAGLVDRFAVELWTGERFVIRLEAKTK